MISGYSSKTILGSCTNFRPVKKPYFISLLVLLTSLIFNCAREPEYPPEITELQQAVENNPDNNMRYEELIKALIKAEYYQPALDNAQKLIALDNNYPYGYIYAGICSETLTDWQQAGEYYEELITKLPEDSRGYYYLGSLLYREGKYEQAIENLKKALATGIKDKTSQMETLNFLALAYYYNKQKDPACETLDKVLKIDPLNPEALYHYGTWKLRQGKYDEAVQYLNKLISLNPQTARPYLRLAKAYYHQRDIAKSEQAFLDASRYDGTCRPLAEIVRVQAYTSTYRDINTAMVKTMKQYNYRKGTNYYVRGIVENIGLEVAQWCSVVVRFYDRNNNVLTQKVINLSPRNLRPEQYAFFNVKIPDNEKISDVKVEPNWHKRSASISLK